MGCCATCGICIGAIVSYIRTRPGIAKLLVFIFALIASIICDANFAKLQYGEGFEFTLACTNFW